MIIPFNKIYTSSESVANVKDLTLYPERILEQYYTKRCSLHFESIYPEHHAVMVASCTAALELAAISLDFCDDEEIIMPSYNFVGVANAFALHGAKLVFVDIEPNSMNICANAIEKAITNKTKAVLMMHYSGVACEIDKIKDICSRHNLLLIEDNAQGIGVTYKNQLLGSYGDFSTISFDSQKNLSCSEGGILLYKKKYHDTVMTAFDNGTNKQAFSQGLTPSFEWTNKGSKFTMSEYNAAILSALLDEQSTIIEERKEKWFLLYKALSSLTLPRDFLPEHMNYLEHNAHIFFVKCKDMEERKALINHLNNRGIRTMFHYIPLHSSVYAKKHGFILENDLYTTIESQRVLRLPIYNALSQKEINHLASSIHEFYSQK